MAKSQDFIQRSLVVLKPDTVQRGIIGEVIQRFERVGLKIVATKMVNPDKDHYYHHYEEISKMVSRRGQKAFDLVLDDGEVAGMGTHAELLRNCEVYHEICLTQYTEEELQQQEKEG